MEALAIFTLLVMWAAHMGSHCTWAHPWWRSPAFTLRGKPFSDRWHGLSFLVTWPTTVLILAGYVRPGAFYWRWILVAAGIFILVQLVKLAAGKEWQPIWIQLYHVLRGK